MSNSKFDGANVLVTGGLGFIGSSVAIALVNAGAKVTIVDAMIPEYGGNLFNIEPIRDKVTINYGDVCDPHAMDWLVRGKDYVFHIAGQVSHVMSLTNPYPDIEYNIKGTVVLMEALRRFNPSARVVFTGTRGQYGPAVKLPVSEDTPMNPKGIHEISNMTAEKIILNYNDIHGIRSTLLRLTNIYGPRGQMKHPHYCVVNWFVRLVLDGEEIPIFGDGEILRDFLYIDDCTKAILMAAYDRKAEGETFNVGLDKPTSFKELVETLVKVAGCGGWHFAEFSPERKAQEPGDYYSDVSKIKGRIGWEPETALEPGLNRTLDYYRENGQHYWK